MLKTETNTEAMRRRVLSAAKQAGLSDKPSRLQADFEHGQFWITNLDTGAQWSVCDAAGPGTRWRGNNPRSLYPLRLRKIHRHMGPNDQR